MKFTKAQIAEFSFLLRERQVTLEKERREQARIIREANSRLEYLDNELRLVRDSLRDLDA